MRPDDGWSQPRQRWRLVFRWWTFRPDQSLSAVIAADVSFRLPGRRHQAAAGRATSGSALAPDWEAVAVLSTVVKRVRCWLCFIGVWVF